MSTAALSDVDVRVREHVVHQLDSDPEVDASGIGVFNHIVVAGTVAARDVRHRIVQALHRHADLDARQVVISVTGEVATLTGTVTTWQQRDIAERAAASAPGITRVENEIRVRAGGRHRRDVLTEQQTMSSSRVWQC